MSEVEYTDEDSAAVEPGFEKSQFRQQAEGAGASSEPEVEAVEPDGESAEVEEVEESEGESPSPVEDNDDEKTYTFEEASGFAKERIDKLTERFRETERTNEQLANENAELLKRFDETPGPAGEVKTLADFEYDETAYRAYIVDDTRRIAGEEAARVARTFQKNTQEDVVRSEYDGRADVFAKTVTDFDKVVKDRSLSINQPMAEIIQDVDVGPEVAYYLGKNPDEALTLSELSPAKMGMEMSKIVDRLRTEKAKAAKKTVSKAPPPPAKIRGADAAIVVSSTDPKSDKMSDEAWQRAEDLREAKLRG